MKVVILGLGQLGKDLHETFLAHDWDVRAFTKLGCDITNHEQTRSMLHFEKPDLVINCAAIHDLPTCESNPELSAQVNVSGATRLAMLTNNTCDLIHISTDQVFDGELGRPYKEDDGRSPLNVYSKHKIVSENCIRAFNPQSFVIRTGALYGGDGPRQKGGNFVTKLLKNRGSVTMTTRGRISATWIRHLSEAIEQILFKKAFYGVYHLTNSGDCSWFEFAQEIIGQSGRTDITLVPTDSDPSGINRPSYSVLDCSKAASFGVILPPWKEGVRAYLGELRNLHPELFQR